MQKGRGDRNEPDVRHRTLVVGHHHDWRGGVFQIRRMELFRQFLLLFRNPYHHRFRRLRRTAGTYEILIASYVSHAGPVRYLSFDDCQHRLVKSRVDAVKNTRSAWNYVHNFFLIVEFFFVIINNFLNVADETKRIFLRRLRAVKRY